MNKPRVIVSSCGTSLLTNQTENNLRNLINKLANDKEADLTPADKQRLDTHIHGRQTLLMDTAELGEVKKLSAELNGIITYYGGNFTARAAVPDQHFLVVSDTYLGKSVGQMIQAWLESRTLQVQKLELPGFVTNDRDSFRDAMTQLIKWCQDTLQGYREIGSRIVFNLTGGFKSAQGFLQTIGMFYADESIYIFETGTLLTIPRLPIKLDVDGTVGQHLATFRQLGLGEELSSEACQGIAETLLLQVGGKATLSEWGELIWQNAKASYYGERLLDPFSSNLTYSDKFRSGVQKLNLTAERMEVLNQRLDQLNLIIQGRGKNLRGNDFKALKGNSLPPSTHECDIWSDWEYRLFGHYLDAHTFMIDDVDRGLH